MPDAMPASEIACVETPVLAAPPRSRRRSSQKTPQKTPAVLPLRVNDLLFITEYLSNGRNATRAYMAVHPKAKYTSAESSAHDLLSKPKVKAEIAKRIEYEGGITKQMVESTLLQALSWANEKQDHLGVAQIAMDCAKLAGFLIEKREIRQVSTEERSAISELVRSAIGRQPAMPSYPQPADAVSSEVSIT